MVHLIKCNGTTTPVDAIVTVGAGKMRFVAPGLVMIVVISPQESLVLVVGMVHVKITKYHVEHQSVIQKHVHRVRWNYGMNIALQYAPT